MHLTENGLALVKATRQIGAVRPGEIAGFLPDVATRLVGAGEAQWHYVTDEERAAQRKRLAECHARRRAVEAAKEETHQPVRFRVPSVAEAEMPERGFYPADAPEIEDEGSGDEDGDHVSDEEAIAEPDGTSGVAIPEDWESAHGNRKKKWAAAITGQPVDTVEQAEAVIRGELVRREQAGQVIS